MRVVSLNARLANDARGSADVEVVLFRISHPLVDEPVLLSTDPTERMSVEPLRYGTRSTWPDGTLQWFRFALVSALVPDDKGDAPATASLVLANLDNGIAKVLRSFTDRATVDMAVVLHTSPNLVELEQIGLKLVAAEGNDDQITLRLSRDPLTSEPWPSGRQTRSRFPGINP